MQLQDFYDYKNQLMQDLLTNETVVHLLNENIQFEDAQKLAYSQVFPFEYVPETEQEGRTFICCDVDVYHVDDKTFYQPVLYVWIFAHKSQLRLPEGGVRTDKLCSEVCKLINGSRKYTLGELSLYSAKRFAPMTDYNGKMLTFEGKEFNTQYDPKKYTPANRKLVKPTWQP